MPAFAASAISFAMSFGSDSSRKPAYGTNGCLWLG